MRPNIKFFKDNFDYYNKLIFKNELPSVPIVLSTRSLELGRTIFGNIQDSNGKKVPYIKSIEMSIKMDMSSESYVMILVHEMIHCYIFVKHLKDDSEHGHVFRSIMNKINQEYGLNITVNGNDIDWYKVMPHNRRYIFCIIHLNDGSNGICIAPKNKIFEFWRTLKDNCCSFNWYTSYDPYFGKFGVTSVLGFVPIDLKEAESHLSNAEELTNDGQTISVVKHKMQ